MAKIFVVEDDENIRELIGYALNSAGYAYVGFERSQEFWSALAGELPDMIVLDIMLPGEDGLSILRKLRSKKDCETLPVMMLTAKGSEYDKVKGLDEGADDYMSKPFSVLELLSRVRALLRRTVKASASHLLTGAGLVIDSEKHTVIVGDVPINLTYKEFELLFMLMENTGKVLTREKIMDSVWGFDFQGESRTVDMHIKTLRQKIGKAGDYIATVRGVGYRFEEQL